MQSKATVLLNPPPAVLLKLPQAMREEANWYAEMGMPISGNVALAVRRVVTSKVWSKGGTK